VCAHHARPSYVPLLPVSSLPNDRHTEPVIAVAPLVNGSIASASRDNSVMYVGAMEPVCVCSRAHDGGHDGHVSGTHGDHHSLMDTEC
jgi:hypothetical protein